MRAVPKIEKLNDKAAKRLERRAAKKNELADSAIEVLSQLGYAQTSLRDIAQHCGVSLGTIHYYFEDRVDLISYCTLRYKEGFAQMLEQILSAGGTAAQIRARFIDSLIDTIEQEADKHRLWYDMRAQALFDESFHATVDEIETLQIEIFGRLLSLLGLPDTDPLRLFLPADAAFRFYLQRWLRAKPHALADFRKALDDLFDCLGAAVRA